MNKQTLYIILIIALFNFLLLNIFRLQKDINNIRCKTDKVKNIVKPYNYSNKNSNIKTKSDNIINKNSISQYMDKISEVVPKY